jgi:hypothetical protein
MEPDSWAEPVVTLEELPLAPSLGWLDDIEPASVSLPPSLPAVEVVPHPLPSSCGTAPLSFGTTRGSIASFEVAGGSPQRFILSVRLDATVADLIHGAREHCNALDGDAALLLEGNAYDDRVSGGGTSLGEWLATWSSALSRAGTAAQEGTWTACDARDVKVGGLMMRKNATGWLLHASFAFRLRLVEVCRGQLLPSEAAWVPLPQQETRAMCEACGHREVTSDGLCSECDTELHAFEGDGW